MVDAFDPKSSAAEADLRQGDILSRVDGVDVIGMPVPAVAEKIFGPVGSPVRIHSHSKGFLVPFAVVSYLD